MCQRQFISREKELWELDYKETVASSVMLAMVIRDHCGIVIHGLYRSKKSAVHRNGADHVYVLFKIPS